MDEDPPFDRHVLESMNEKAIQNQFFTPDRVYIDLGLFKDIPIGVMYADAAQKDGFGNLFIHLQSQILPLMKDYQTRTYDTVTPYFGKLGYGDDTLAKLLLNTSNHDIVFMMSPATRFLDMLIRHTVRNQNNSRPAAKYTKKMINSDQYVMEPIEVTYSINTYPLTLSEKLLVRLAQDLGESLGVNITFLNKDPMTFDEADWTSWLKNIDCFYLDSIGRFNRGDMVLQKQDEMKFTGCYIFARKRFENCVISDMRGEDFNKEIQIVTAHLDIFCDFAWIQNTDVRLVDDVPLISET